MRRMAGLVLVAAARAQDAWLAEAEKKMGAGDFAGVLATCDKAIEGAPGDPRAHAGRARALLELGRYDEALAGIQRAIELAPKADALYLHTRAAIRFAKGDQAAALSDIEQALEVDPARGGLYLLRGDISYGKHDYDAALRDYTKALDLGVVAFERRASARIALCDWKGAIADYTALAELFSSYPYALCLRGDVKAMLSDWKGAIADYDAAIARKEHAPSYLGRANAHSALGDRKAADADATKAVETCPCVECFSSRGKYYYDTGRPKEAVADLAKAVQMGPDWQDYSRLFLFLARAKLGEREAAAAELKSFADGREEKDDWYAKVAAFLCGAIEEEKLLAAAKAESGHRARELECEACWYAGAVRLLDGDAAGARARFERCVATDRRNFIEHRSAKAALAAMK